MHHPILAPGIGCRIAAAADRLGTRRSAAEAMGVSTDALQRYIREENAPAFEVVARLCVAARVRMEWVATDQGPMQADQAAPGAAAEVDREALQVALELVEEALTGRILPPPQRAELIALVYDLVIAPEELPTAAITHIIRAASGGSK